MTYKILVDSCVDLNESVFGENEKIGRIPFSVSIDGEEYIDNLTNVMDRLTQTNFSTHTIKTASPSPHDYYVAYEEARNAFVVTISSELSGSYSAAVLAKNLISEEHPEQYDIHIVDCKSASAGESLVAFKLLQLLKENMQPAKIVDNLTHYIKNLKTYFVLDSLDTLVSNGRVHAIKELACKALKIFPIMGDNGNGKIELKVLARGKKNAFSKMIDIIGETNQDFRDTVLAITHVNAYETACDIKRRIQSLYSFKDVFIFEASGLSSVYAGNGGIVIAY